MTTLERLENNQKKLRLLGIETTVRSNWILMVHTSIDNEYTILNCSVANTSTKQSRVYKGAYTSEYIAMCKYVEDKGNKLDILSYGATDIVTTIDLTDSLDRRIIMDKKTLVYENVKIKAGNSNLIFEYIIASKQGRLLKLELESIITLKFSLDDDICTASHGFKLSILKFNIETLEILWLDSESRLKIVEQKGYQEVNKHSN